MSIDLRLRDFLYHEEPGITLYCGDARTIVPLLARDAIAVMVTDPPYGLAFVTGRRNGERGWSSRWTGVEIDGDSDVTVRDEVLAWWGDKPALVFGTWKTTAPSGVRETLVWNKVVSTGMGALDIPWRPSWECVYVLGRGFHGSRGHGVLSYSLPTLSPDRQLHPTPKPLALMKALLAKCPDGIVLDPFVGSGTTLEAAKNLGRRAIGIEIEERYCEIAAKRLRQSVLAFP